MRKVYLAGQPNEYANDWKEELKKIPNFQFHDWEFDSDQTSPDTFFPDDIKGIYSSDILIANPGTAPSEATWIEIGIFYSKNVVNPGDLCRNLIIIWNEDRNPKWSIEFVKKAGVVVSSVEDAMVELKNI